MKHWDESWKYDDARRTSFDLGMKHCVQAWYYFSNKMILEGEIKDAKMGSFSSDFQKLKKKTLISFEFYLWIVSREVRLPLFSAVKK